MSYNLFLDDVRDPNQFLKSIKTWVVVRNYNEFVDKIKERGLPDFISFDHDLAWEHYPFSDEHKNDKRIIYDRYTEKTGYHAAQWLINYCNDNNKPLPEFQVHSQNPEGRRNINQLLNRFKEIQDTQI